MPNVLQNERFSSDPNGRCKVKSLFFKKAKFEIRSLRAPESSKMSWFSRKRQKKQHFLWNQVGDLLKSCDFLVRSVVKIWSERSPKYGLRWNICCGGGVVHVAISGNFTQQPLLLINSYSILLCEALDKKKLFLSRFGIAETSFFNKLDGLMMEVWPETPLIENKFKFTKDHSPWTRILITVSWYWHEWQQIWS